MSLRILMTADTVGGVWTYALELARALAPHDVQVHLATMGALPSAAQRADAERLPHLTLHTSEYKLEWMPSPWEDVARAGEWLLEREQAVQPDVVHLNGYVHGALPWTSPVLVAGHSCVLSWYHAAWGTAAQPGWEQYREQVTCGLQSADAVVAPTDAMLQMLNYFYGPFAAASVIYNGREASLFQPQAKEEFVLAAGRIWDEAKNIKTLAEAAQDLPWPVLVAGEAQGMEGSTASFDNVSLLGALSPAVLADRMGRAAIYALPARYEPFGLSALEAGLAGCALVLGDIPSLREVWGDSALFVDPNDIRSVRQTLQDVIRDSGLRREMAARAQTQACRYTPERMANGYLDLYRRLSNKSPMKEKNDCGSSCFITR